MRRTKCVLLSLIGVILFLMMLGCEKTSNTSLFEKQVRENNYKKSIDIYQSAIAGDAQKENNCYQFLNTYQKECWSLYENGDMNSAEFDKILTTLNMINVSLGLLPDLSSTMTQYQDIEASRAHYQNGIDAQKIEDYPKAIVEFSNVLKKDKLNYNSAQEELSKSIEMYHEQIISIANEKIAQKNYEDAVSFLLDVQQNSSFIILDVDELIDTALKQMYSEKMTTLIKQADYLTVFSIYEEALADNRFAVNDEIEGLYATAKDAYVQQVLDRASVAFGSNKDYNSALAIVYEALHTYNLQEELEQYFYYYLSYEPVYLTELEYTTKAEYISVVPGGDYRSKDVNEIEHTQGGLIYPCGGWLNTQWASSDEEAYVTYYINRNYSTFTGVIYRPYETLSCPEDWGDGGGHARIYGDDRLLYESPTIGQKTYDPIQFTLDVSGVRELKIVARGVWSEETTFIGIYSYNPALCLGDLVLQK